MIAIITEHGKPSCRFSTVVSGRVTSGNIVLPEAFVINGQGVHLVQTGLNGTEYAGVGAWSEQGGAYVYKCLISSAPALRYEAMIAPRGDGIIEFALTVRNLSGLVWNEWSHVTAHVAFDQPELQDTDGARTYVVDAVPNGLGLVPIAGMVTIPSDGLYAWQWGLNVSNPNSGEAHNVHFPLVARLSTNRQWVGVAVDNAATVGGNMRQRCIHANPRPAADVQPNGVFSTRGRVLLDEPSGGAILLGSTLALYS